MRNVHSQLDRQYGGPPSAAWGLGLDLITCSTDRLRGIVEKRGLAAHDDFLAVPWLFYLRL